jgi:predicted nucleotidyltransferase
MSSREETFSLLVAHAQEDDAILALFVFGSRGRKVATDDASDYDVAVILRDDAALSAFDEQWPYTHGAEVEVVSATLDDLREHAAVGGNREWARYQYAHVEMVVDKTGGEIQGIIDAKERIPDHLRDKVVRPALGAYLNFTYRSLRNDSVGLGQAARLDAAESLPGFLTVMFGLEGRVRPYNKYLEWELRHHALTNPDCEADRLLALIASVVDGNTDAQRELFRMTESAARLAGYGDELDGWEPDLNWMRGLTEYRTAR